MTPSNTPTPATGIRIEAVTLERAGQRLFDGLTLSLDEPRIGLIGDNGAGKSSLLRLIAGLEQPAQGRVVVHGCDTRSGRLQLPQHVGLMFQNPEDQIIFPTVEEELAFTLSARGMPRKQARTEARAFLAAQGLADWAARAVGELSQGQRQRVCLLAMQIGRPTTLLLDEPFASLDLPSQARLSRQILGSPQQLVFSTHVLAQVRSFPRVLWLDHGRVRADGPGPEVCDTYQADVLRRTQETAATPC
jgi:biotin transport system ATP-binding protein